METKHVADIKFPKWLDDLAKGKIIKKAARDENTFIPYGMNERATQLGSQSFESFITQLIKEDEDDNEDEGEEILQSDPELKQMERNTEELSFDKEAPAPEDKPEPKDKPEDKPEPKDKLEDDFAPTDDKGDSAPAPDSGDGPGSSDELSQLKKQVEELGTVKDFDYRLKKIEDLLENLEMPTTADANLNDSLNQSASIMSDMRMSKRIIRRIKAGKIQKKDAIKKLNKIFSKF